MKSGKLGNVARAQNCFERLNRVLPYSNVPVLLYHQIVEASKEKNHLGIAVSPNKFEQHMHYLSAHGYSTITLDDILCTEYIDLSKQIAITFDDGYLDNYETAFPILQKFKFSATIFIVTNFMGKKDAPSSYMGAGYMSWSHCKEMLNYGISFQSHTCNHPYLTSLTESEVTKELLESKIKIEDMIGKAVNHFSYPFGRYNRIIMRLAERTGYKTAYAAGYSGRENYCRERFRIKSDYGKLIFALQSSRWGSWIRSLKNFNSSGAK